MGTGDQTEVLGRLVSRVATLEAAAGEAEAQRRALHNQLVELRGNVSQALLYIVISIVATVSGTSADIDSIIAHNHVPALMHQHLLPDQHNSLSQCPPWQYQQLW